MGELPERGAFHREDLGRLRGSSYEKGDSGAGRRITLHDSPFVTLALDRSIRDSYSREIAGPIVVREHQHRAAVRAPSR